MNKALDVLFVIIVASLFVLVPHVIYMSLWEFITWGDAIWNIGEWTNIRRSVWLVYEIIFVIGVVISDWR